jgi:tetratricopeptide (TPR) repeat protein
MAHGPDGAERLDSWKQIAAYLKREVRTVQLWEKREGLPVHRHFHNQLGSVFAFRAEIDAWTRRRAVGPTPIDNAVQQHAPRAPRLPSPAAREAYLKGRYHWSRRSEQDLRKAMGWFDTAIREDPDFALPYTGVADSFTLLAFYEIVSPAEAMPRARDAAMRAIALDPDLAEAHTSLADIHLHFDWQWEAAGREYRKAIQCNPGYALGYHWYANLLAATGQHDAAYVAVMQALEIDPAAPINQVWAGVTSHLARRFDDAIRHYRNALELEPNLGWAHMYLAQSLEQKGRYAEAIAEFDTALLLSGGSDCVSAMKAHAHAMAGERAAAHRLLGDLQRAASVKCAPSYDIAATHAALGDSGQAVRWLQRACLERNMKLFLLSQDPRFDSLRGQSEFRGVMQHLGLANDRTQPTAH